MTRRNADAADAAAALGAVVHAATDVTGFGLLGHLFGMMKASKKRAKLFWRQVPVMEGVMALAKQGTIPGGTKSNLAYVEQAVDFDPALPEEMKWVLVDAQTNGGLLAALPSPQADAALRALKRAGINAARIGEVVRADVGIEVKS